MLDPVGNDQFLRGIRTITVALYVSNPRHWELIENRICRKLLRMSQKYTYRADPKWADVTSIPQDDGGPNALATIAYTDEYREAMSYLRAVMAANEYSERALDLTEHIIKMNPAHYTVW